MSVDFFSRESIKKFAVETARKATTKFPLGVGDLVSDRLDGLIYRVVDVVGDELLVECPVDCHDQKGPKIKEVLSKQKAFDARIAIQTAREGEMVRRRLVAKSN